MHMTAAISHLQLEPGSCTKLVQPLLVRYLLTTQTAMKFLLSHEATTHTGTCGIQVFVKFWSWERSLTILTTAMLLLSWSWAILLEGMLHTTWHLYPPISWQENSTKEASTLLGKGLIEALDTDSKSHAFIVYTAQRGLWTVWSRRLRIFEIGASCQDLSITEIRTLRLVYLANS